MEEIFDIILGRDFAAMNSMGVIWTREETHKLMHSNRKTIMELPDSTARVLLVLTYSVKMNAEVREQFHWSAPENSQIKWISALMQGFPHRNPNVHIPPSCVDNPGNAFYPKYITLSTFNLSHVDHSYIGGDTIVDFADEPTLDV